MKSESCPVSSFFAMPRQRSTKKAEAEKQKWRACRTRHRKLHTPQGQDLVRSQPSPSGSGAAATAHAIQLENSSSLQGGHPSWAVASDICCPPSSFTLRHISADS